MRRRALSRLRYPSFPIPHSRRAMTLLEILTGMMVSVMLIGTAFSTFWVATTSWEKAKRRAEMIRLLDGVADLITRQLRAIQPPFYPLSPAFLAYNDGDETADFDSMAFVTSANPRFPPELALSDLCEVEFYIDVPVEEGLTGGMSQTADMGMGTMYDPLMNMMGEMPPSATGETETQATQTGGLWMRIDPTPDDDLENGGYLVDLGIQITSFNLRFYDGYEWLEDWLNDSQVPQAVEFSLTCTDPEGRENPITLTRLVRIPTARAINQGSQNLYGDLTGGYLDTTGSGQSFGGQSGYGSAESGTGSEGTSGGSSYSGGSGGSSFGRGGSSRGR
ncbi:MAG: hypothetical protein N3D11_07290 [Candidatus Sumerlaeia bacterium]|nr:hypothetical protein [Candidatus Sumerlaeia bacterium]